MRGRVEWDRSRGMREGIRRARVEWDRRRGMREGMKSRRKG